ncbi:metalloprotease [Candidatus Caldarchaeum subterraneum]|uniref:Metalloprotease n=1 Tax=Caldiarchaeum subterraneum TaxID=311458 RepID=E6PAS9_CALS0|nr:metalloprotease [Candidatus Caldarchaeum subterraneum]
MLYRVIARRKGTGAEDASSISVTLYPLFLIVKSRSISKPLDILAQKLPRFWDAVSRAAVATGFGLMALAIYILSSNLSTYLFRPEQVGGQNIVIPLIIGVTIRLENLPYLFLAFAIVLITHEGLHGIAARREGLPVKSAGIFMIFVVPGGFVEPDEEAFKSASPGARMRVAAVGSFANIAVGLLALMLMFGAFVPQELGLIALQVEPNSRIKVNDIIVSVDDVPVNRGTLGTSIIIKETIRIKTLTNEYVFDTNPDVRGREFTLGSVLRGLGVTQVDTFFPSRITWLDPFSAYNFYRALYWLQLVSIGVAVFNMLPIYMLDGSLVLRAVLEKFVKEGRHAKVIINTVALLCIGLVVANISFTYATFGFFQI